MGNQQTNYGCAVLNDTPIGKTATIAATGLGRSGTTMLARIMTDMGLDMGGRLTPQSSEDRDIQKLLKNRNLDRFGEFCRARDANSDVWAFKVPALRGMVVEASEHMRNPRLIVSFRDIMAVSQRNALSVDADLLEALVGAAQGYVNLMRRIEALKIPILLISYEKALQYPDETVSAMAGFCGLKLSQKRIAQIAAANIQNADPRYTGVVTT